MNTNDPEMGNAAKAGSAGRRSFVYLLRKPQAGAEKGGRVTMAREEAPRAGRARRSPRAAASPATPASATR